MFSEIISDESGTDKIRLKTGNVADAIRIEYLGIQIKLGNAVSKWSWITKIPEVGEKHYNQA